MRLFRLVLATSFALLLMTGCGFSPSGSGSSSSSSSSSTTAVTITSSASSARLGDTAGVQFTATVTNGGGSAVTWAVNGTSGGSATVGTIDANGKYLPPAVGATTLANPTTVSITATVKGVTSSPVTVSLQNPVPTVTSVAVTGGTLTVGTPATVTVTGTNFVSGAQILVGTTAVTTTFVNATTLTASINATAAGNLSISVKNPDPGTATSTQTVTVAAVAAGPTISGVAAKGLLQGATVEVWAVDPATGNDSGTAAIVSKSNATAADGTFSVSLPTTPAAGTPLRVKAIGGTYPDETDTSKTITNTITLDTLIDDGSKSVSGLAITPVTEMINSLTTGAVQNSLANGVTTSAYNGGPAISGATVPAAHASAKATIQGHWGVKSDPEKTPPKTDAGSLTSAPDSITVGLISGSMLTCAKKALSGGDVNKYISALSQDISDGVFDGMYITKDASGNKVQKPVLFPGTTTPLSQSAGTTDFLLCMNQYVSNPVSAVSSISSSLQPIVSSVTTSVANSPATPASAGLTSGTSGSVASMAINGKQWLFIAARSNGIVAMDITDPNATAPTTKVWSTLAQTVFQGAHVGGVVPVVGVANHAQLLAYAYGSKVVALINAEVLTTGTPGTDDAKAINQNPISSDATGGDFQGSMTFTSTAQASFSGGSAYIAGAFADPGRKGAWLGTVDGIQKFDYASKAFNKLYKFDVNSTLGVNQELGENIGADITHNYIVNSNYSGLQLIDLAGDASYDLPQSTVTAAGGYWDVDQVAVDTTYQVAVNVNEHSGTLFLLNLANTAKSGASATTPGTLTPATGAFLNLSPMSSGSYASFSSIAVESSKHLALISEEYGNGPVMVAQIDNPAAPKGASWAGFADWAFLDTSSSSISSQLQSGLMDPHSIGAIFNTGAGKPYAYLLDASFGKVLQVDMQGMLAMPRTSDGHTVTGDPAVAATGATPVWRVITLQNR